MEFYVYNNSNKMLNKACLVDAITTLDLQKKDIYQSTGS